jgi:ribose transport system permease protein
MSETIIDKNKFTPRDQLKRFMSHSETGTLIILAVLIIGTGLLNKNFYSLNNVTSILRALAFIMIVAIGETLVIITGEIDISVGSVAGLGAVLAPWFMTNGLNVPLSIVLALVICGVIGFINGTVVTRLKVSSFIATIGMLYIARGVNMYITKGYPIYPLPDVVNNIGNSEPLGISVAFIIAIFLIIIFDTVLRRTVYGRKLYAVGDNTYVARIAGIDSERIKRSVYMICGVLAGLSGILLSAQLNNGTPTIGNGWELQVIAATAVGGISLNGGSGTILGTAIGVIILSTLNNSLVLLGIDTQVQTILTGVVMIAAVTFDTMKRSRKLKA